MKIGMVVDNELNGDVRVLNEAKYLVRKGFDVHVLCFTFGQPPRHEVIEGIRVTRAPIRKRIKNKLFALNNFFPAYDLLWERTIAAFLKQEKIDVLHAHDLYMARPAHLAVQGKGIPLVLDLHENYPAAVMTYKWATQFPYRLVTHPARWQKREPHYLQYADKIIVLSQNYRDQLLRKYPFLPKQAFTVYPNVPDLEAFSGYPVDPHILHKGSSFLLFYFGVIAERRGIFTSIEALRMLVQQGLDIKLLLIGRVDKSDQARLDDYLNDPVLKEALIHYPWKDIQYLPSYVHVSDVCLSPIFRNDQHESGVANKIFQYMLFGRPLLVSDCFPQKQIVTEEACGLSFESDNAADMAAKVVTLLKNPDVRKQMGENGKQAVRNKYNIEVAGQALVRMYEELQQRKL